MNERESYAYNRWKVEQEQYANSWLRRFLRRKEKGTLLEDMKPFDPDKQLDRCDICHVACWGYTHRCKKHKKSVRSGKDEYRAKYRFYYDKYGNKLPV